MPQPPQLLLSLSVSAHWLPQHSGATPWHVLPQLPQLFVSLSSSVQLLEQQPGFTPLQVLSHAPQFPGSDVVSTQLPSQRVWAPQSAAHCPPMHMPDAQVFPQPPQLLGSLSLSTH
jgi:hypothetical protein